MADDTNRALSAISSMLIELFAHQIATKSVLRSLPGFDESAYRKELQSAHNQLKGVPGVANLPNQINAQQLEGIAQQLQLLMLKK